MKFPALFLDRDNTINFDPGYLSNPDEVKILEGVGEGLAKLKSELNFKLIVVSNQSGIARGFFDEQVVISVNNKINEILSDKFNVTIDKFYFCPHHPDFSSEEDSKCRKPSPKMILEAAEKMEIDLKKSYLIGDSVSDILSGINAGIKTILFDKNNDSSKIISLKKINKNPNFTVDNFLIAVDFIIADFLKGDTFDK